MIAVVSFSFFCWLVGSGHRVRNHRPQNRRSEGHPRHPPSFCTDCAVKVKISFATSEVLHVPHSVNGPSLAGTFSHSWAVSLAFWPGFAAADFAIFSPPITRVSSECSPDTSLWGSAVAGFF